MAEPPQVVAVTGAAGYIGSKLLEVLEDEESLSKVVTFDVKPLRRPVHRIATRRLDITGPIDEVLEELQVDTLVHLAFTFPSGKHRRQIDHSRKVNLDGVRNVLKSCRQARVRHLIYLSSHTVYGPHPDNPVPITEERRLNPLLAFPYSYDKALAERLIEDFVEEDPGTDVTVLRSCVVLGPEADNYVSRALFAPVMLGMLGYNPPWQFVHEEDLARLIAFLVMNPQPGTFNVASQGIVNYSDVARLAGRPLLRLPPGLAYLVAQLSWSLRLQREAPAGGIDFVRYPIVLSTGKLRKETGFCFRYSSQDALTSFLAMNMA